MISGVRFTKEQLHVTRRAHRADRRADRRVRLHEEHVEGLGVRVQAGFDHVAAVIGALTKDAARRGHWRQEFDRLEPDGRGLAGRSAPVVLAALDQRGCGRIVARQRRDSVRLRDAPARTAVQCESDEVTAMQFFPSD